MNTLQSWLCSRQACRQVWGAWHVAIPLLLEPHARSRLLSCFAQPAAALPCPCSPCLPCCCCPAGQGSSPAFAAGLTGLCRAHPAEAAAPQAARAAGHAAAAGLQQRGDRSERVIKGRLQSAQPAAETGSQACPIHIAHTHEHKKFATRHNLPDGAASSTRPPNSSLPKGMAGRPWGLYAAAAPPAGPQLGCTAP